MNNKYFVYTGNAYPHKNLDTLVDAIKVLNDRSGTRFQLKIISGRSIFRDRLKKLIDNKGADSYIDLLGFIDDEKLKRIYKESLAFVFPTLDEGFGLPPMEAIKAGTLAAVSDIPVLKEVYQDSVFYFDPLDEKSIAEVLLKITQLKESERQNQIAKSQKFLSKYSWEKMAAETLKVYESVV